MSDRHTIVVDRRMQLGDVHADVEFPGSKSKLDNGSKLQDPLPPLANGSGREYDLEEPSGSSTITVISFGFKHPEGAPEADVVIDLRKRLRDPHIDPAMRQMTGLDEAVDHKVMTTKGAFKVLEALRLLMLAMKTPGVPLTIAIGCVGGRHRSVVMATRLAHELGATVVHRDVNKAVLSR